MLDIIGRTGYKERNGTRYFTNSSVKTRPYQGHWATPRSLTGYRAAGPLLECSVQIGSLPGETQTDRDAIRETPEYKEFARAVRIRDNNTCVTCGQVFKGGFNRLHVHHPWMFKWFPDFRLDVDKAVALCERCHMAIHRIPYTGMLVMPVRGDTAAAFARGYSEGRRDAKYD